MDVQLKIPEDVARVIQNQQPDLSRAALEALALEGYRSECLWEGQVRRMLGSEPGCRFTPSSRRTTSISITPSMNLRMT
jgi:hypothetical protein